MISGVEGFGNYLAIHLFISLIFILSHSRTTKAVGQENSSNFHYSRLSIFLLFIGYIAYITFSVFRKIEFGCGGVDAYSYKRIFESAVGQSFWSFNSSRKEEILYNFITWTISRFTSDFKIVLFFMHSISYICFARSYKYIVFKNNRITNFLYTFVILGWLFTMFNTIRFGVALSLSLLVYSNVINGKYKPAIIELIITCMIHTSAVILFPPLLLCTYYKHNNKTKRFRSIIIVILAMIAEIVLIPLLSGIMQSSSYRFYGATNGIATGTYFVLIVSIILMMISGRSKNDYLLNHNFVFLICALLCIPIQIKYSIAYRMVILFMPIIYKNFVDLTYSYKIENRNSMFIKAAIYLFAISYFLYRAYTLYTVDFVGDGLYPYIFEK